MEHFYLHLALYWIDATWQLLMEIYISALGVDTFLSALLAAVAY